jgi:hypothetical protein
VLNISRDGWLYFRVALLSFFFSHASQPVPSFRGPAGSGKTTAARTFTMLADPSPAPVRAAPDCPEG